MSLPKEDSVVKPAQKKARDKWDKENMTTLSCKVKKDQAEKVKAHALSRGETVSGFVNRAITETMQRDSSGAGSKTEPAAAQDQTEGSASETFESLLDF